MNLPLPNSFRSGPDERGHFGIFGGRYVAETLMPLILDLEKAYADAKADPSFQKEMNGYLKDYVGRPSPLYFAERLTEHLGGAKIYFKREELNHTGSHKVNNVLGQIMVARRMGKKRIIAETGAGQHGVATATLCARFGLRELVDGVAELARRDDGPAVFVVLACRQQEGDAPIDAGELPGLALPNPTAAPRLHAPTAWIKAVAA
jgi:tryptophan synthase beta chain